MLGCMPDRFAARSTPGLIQAPGGTRARSWQTRASPLTRYALLAYTLIVVDASLYPFTGWIDRGIGAFAFLDTPWPARLYAFDVAVNAAGYVPLGLFAGLALHPWLRGPTLALGALAYCGLLSFVLEAVQTFLPARVASLTDLASNLAGGLVGSIVAARFARPLLDTGRLRAWRARWFAPDASRGLVLVLVWFGALVYPESFVLGMGGLLKAFDPDLAEALGARADLPAFDDPDLSAAQFEAAEAVIAALALVGVAALFVNTMRDRVPPARRVLLALSLVAATFVAKSLAQAFLFGDAQAGPWFVPGARSGFVAGALLVAVTALLPRRMRWAVGFAALLSSIALVNLMPGNPYATPVSAAFTRGRLLNFYGLARGLDLVWPFFAIAYLLRHRGPHDARRAVTGRSL